MNEKVKNSLKNRISTWNKWDLHIHTPSTNQMVPKDYKNTDLFSDDEFVNKLYLNNISLGVITDHNVFDATRFSSLSETIKRRNEIEKRNLVLLPGVEINVCFKNSQKDPIHFILIFDNKEDLKKIEKAVQILNQKIGFTKGNPKDATIDDIAEAFSSFNYIVSIHLGKSSNIPRDDNYDEFLKIYIGGFVSICENNPANKVQNKEYLEKRLKEITGNKSDSIFIVGSDNHDITKYPLGENVTVPPKLTFFKAIPSFEGLKMVITEPTRIYNSENDNVPDYISQINDINKIESIKIESEKIGIKEIHFSRELNTIIGSRTSGKSLLLNIIKHSLGKEYDEEKYGDYIKESDIKVKTFDEDEFKENKSLQLEVFDQNRLMDEFIKIKSDKDFFKDTCISKKFSEISLDEDIVKSIYEDEIEPEINFIKNICDLYEIIDKIKIPNVYLKNYINFGKNTDNFSKFYLNILKVINFEKSLIKLNEQKTYLTNSIKYVKYIIENDKYGYIKSDDKKMLNRLLSDFNDKLELLSKKIKAVELVSNLDISKYKPFSVNQNFFEQHSEFKQNIRLIAKLKRNLDLILLKQDLFENRTFKYNGDEKYEKSINVQNFVFSSSINYNTNFYTKETEKKHIVKKHFYNDDIKEDWKGLVSRIFLRKLSNKVLFKSGNMDSIISEIKLERPTVYNTIKDDKGIDINDTSPGNRASVLISVILENLENKILIIDQPEDNLDSKFIYQEIVKKLKQLKTSRQIFLVTHNANIVINSDSENVICCKNDNNVINYEYGAIEYDTKIFDNKNMKEFIMDNLEGTEEAFKLRNAKYFLKGVSWNENNNNRQ